MTEVDLSSETVATAGGKKGPATRPAAKRRAETRIRIRSILLTLAAIGVAIPIASLAWEIYMAAPWTRDGRVRVEVADIAPEVSGTVVRVNVQENQFVHKGDVLFEIDPTRFRLAVRQAEATAESRRQDLMLRTADARRRHNLEGAVSAEEKERYQLSAAIALANYNEALAQLDVAKLNLERSKLYSTVNGYATNVRLRVGDYATAGRRAISVVDADSFWIFGYFEETQLARVHPGDTVTIDLMGYDERLTGHVESFSRGITDRNGQPDEQGLQDVNPIFTWVRLAQRIPVRIHIDRVPDSVHLVAGMTCTIWVQQKRTGIEVASASLFRWLTGPP
jgi:multidrug resistance efflux pump